MTTHPTRRVWLVMAGAAGLGLLGAFAFAQPAERVVKIVAKKFEYAPDKLVLQLGQPVLIELTTLDVTMGFSAYELGLHGDIVPGRVTQLRFTPDKVGNFEFSCDVFCGSGHEEMGGVIVVTA
jgi:cytochrome c oxidase subunit 2